MTPFIIYIQCVKADVNVKQQISNYPVTRCRLLSAKPILNVEFWVDPWWWGLQKVNTLGWSAMKFFLKTTIPQHRNVLRRRKRRIACHRWVCWWAWSPILELQTREQLSHGQTLRLLRGWAPSELLFYVPELRLANLRTGWLLHGTEFSRLSDHECHHPGPTGRCHVHCFELTFRASLYRKTSPHCRRFPDASCPRNTCFGIRLSGMRIMWPTHRSCVLSRKASIPIIG